METNRIFIFLIYLFKNIFQLLELNQQSKIRFKSIPCKREKIEFKMDVPKLDLTKVQTPREEIACTKIIYKVYDTLFKKYLYPKP
jgi:hypothetical protein